MGRLGSLPDAQECRVDFEHVRNVLGALRSESVLVDTNNNGSLVLGSSLVLGGQFGVRGYYLALGGADGVNSSKL